MTAEQILKLLELGKIIKLRMPIEEARKLRSHLSTIKHRTEKKYKDVDVPFDHLTLTMKYDESSKMVTFSQIEKPKKNYEVIEVLDTGIEGKAEPSEDSSV